MIQKNEISDDRPRRIAEGDAAARRIHERMRELDNSADVSTAQQQAHEAAQGDDAEKTMHHRFQAERQQEVIAEDKRSTHQRTLPYKRAVIGIVIGLFIIASVLVGVFTPWWIALPVILVAGLATTGTLYRLRNFMRHPDNIAKKEELRTERAHSSSEQPKVQATHYPLPLSRPRRIVEGAVAARELRDEMREYAEEMDKFANDPDASVARVETIQSHLSRLNTLVEDGRQAVRDEQQELDALRFQSSR